MPVVSVPTSFNISLEFDTPGLGRRMSSLVIDLLVQYVYLMLIGYMMRTLFAPVSDFNKWALWLIFSLPVLLYHIVWEAIANGQSIGKKITGLRVVSLNGGRPTISQLLIRWLLRISDLWIIPLLILAFYLIAGLGNAELIFIFVFAMGFLMTDIMLVARSEKAQRIGDILAQTIVIKTSTKESLNSTIFTEVEQDYAPLFPQAMRISDKDLNFIKKILDRNKKSPYSKELMSAAEKVKAYLQLETDLPPGAFLERLLKDYNYLSSR